MMMLNPISNTLKGVVNFTWPMIVISVVVLISLRLTDLIKNKKRFILYKELLSLCFIIYILCLFQVVTFQDTVNWSSNNFIPFREIMRYHVGSRLFLKNVLGNMLLFLPFGFFTSYYLETKKPYIPFFLTMIASVSIECVQLAIGRVFDIDDIILNIAGGLLGYVLYDLLEKIGSSVPKVFHAEWFLNILSILLLIGCITLI